MCRLKLLLVVLLCAGMFFSSGVFADRITIDSSTISATIDGEYGEEVTGDIEAFGVYVDYGPLLNLTLTEDAEGYVLIENEGGNASAYGVYTTRNINNITHSGSMEVIVEKANAAYTRGVYV
ncbi:MAG: hypothetical protein N3D17_05835, partial [bacterium]|nr:hypothetical protein [bacterium]